MNVEISYNGEPITLRTVKNGFNACRGQQYCIKVACKSPARSKTLVTSVSLELLGEIAGLARGVQGLRGKEGPLAAGSSLWRALKAICVKALAKCARVCPVFHEANYHLADFETTGRISRPEHTSRSTWMTSTARRTPTSTRPRPTSQTSSSNRILDDTRQELVRERLESATDPSQIQGAVRGQVGAAVCHDLWQRRRLHLQRGIHVQRRWPFIRAVHHLHGGLGCAG